MLCRRMLAVAGAVSRQSFLAHRNRTILQTCRQRLSTQKLRKSSDLLIKLVGGGLTVGGGSWIVYNNVLKKDDHHVNKASQVNHATTHQQIEHLPEHVSYLIVGGGTAGYSASRAIRTNDPGSQVLIISEESHMPYMRPPLSKELWFSGVDLDKEFTFRQWSGKERSIFFECDEFYMPLEEYAASKNGGISVVTGQRVVKIDATNRKAFLANGQVIGYDKCLIATGGRPKSLQVFEKLPKQAQDRLILFRSIEDFKRLEDAIYNSKSITIVGGGFLGSELACSLAEKSRRLKSKFCVHQIIGENGVLYKVLPDYLSDWCTHKIKDEGVNMLTNTQIEDAQLDKQNQLVLKLNNGQSLTTDYAIVAVGIDPNVDLAAESGLEVDDVLGGYRVNAELETRSNLWVAGDATCFYDQKLGRRRVEHHDHAVVSGRLAGENMTGAGKPYWHQSMFWSDLGIDIGFEAIGVIDSSLPTFAFFARDQDDCSTTNTDKYSKGIIFYQRDNSVVGIVLWNLYNNMHTARRVINDGVKGQDLNEVVKLFSLYPREDVEDESIAQAADAEKETRQQQQEVKKDEAAN